MYDNSGTVFSRQIRLDALEYAIRLDEDKIVEVILAQSTDFDLDINGKIDCLTDDDDEPSNEDRETERLLHAAI